MSIAEQLITIADKVAAIENDVRYAVTTAYNKGYNVSPDGGLAKINKLVDGLPVIAPTVAIVEVQKNAIVYKATVDAKNCYGVAVYTVPGTKPSSQKGQFISKFVQTADGIVASEGSFLAIAQTDTEIAEYIITINALKINTTYTTSILIIDADGYPIFDVDITEKTLSS